MRKPIALVAFFAVMATAGTAAAQDSPSATPLEKGVAYVQPSIVYLDLTWTGWVYDKAPPASYMNDGKPFTLHYSCTGFFVNPDGYIATAGHCVDKANVAPDFFDEAAVWAATCKCYYSDKSLSAATIRGFSDHWRVEGAKTGGSGRYTPGGDLSIQAVWSTSSTEPLYNSATGQLNGEAHETRVVKYLPWNDGSGDVALLKTEVSDQPVLPVNTQTASTGQETISVGYPASVGQVSDASLSDPSFKSGNISSVRTNGTYPVYEMSSALSGGMSGGPTVEPGGHVLGVNSYGLANGADQAFNFAQSSQTLSSLMTDAGVKNELGPVATAYRAGLDAYYAGEKETAVTNLQKAVSLNPDFDMAQEFLTKAQALPDPSSAPIGLIAIGIGLLVLVVVGGVLVMRQRRTVAPAAAVPTASTVAPGFSAPPPAPMPSTAPTPTAAEDVEPPEAAASGSPTTGWYCGTCGAHATDDMQFCSKCGTPRPVG